jgi:hypothetical protein
MKKTLAICFAAALLTTCSAFAQDKTDKMDSKSTDKKANKKKSTKKSTDKMDKMDKKTT